MPTPTPTKEAILAFLESLGSTADEVYESLKARNVKGRRGGPECPIEVALNQEFGDDVAFGVGLYAVSARSVRDFTETPSAIMPDPVQIFISRFDSKEYPDVDINPPPVPAEPVEEE